MSDLTLTVGDTAPPLTMTCAAGGTGTSLAGAAVEVHVLRADRSVITRPATITDAATGTVMMGWEPGDLTVPGTYYVEAQVTYSNGRVQTFGRPLLEVRSQIA